MHSNYTKNLLNLEDVIIKKVIQADTFVRIFIETKPTIQICPNCGKETNHIHDYRSQEVKDLPFQMKHTYLVLRKRRYIFPVEKSLQKNIIFYLNTSERHRGYLTK